MSQPSLDALDRRLLTHVQANFPLDPRPFAALGLELGIGEDEVIARLRHLGESGILRQISAIFDSRLLGYQSTLVAFQVPPGQLETAGQVVSQQPGVSHNYARNHTYNLWFTWTVVGKDGMEERVARLAAQAGARAFLLLPALRVFKIGVTLDLEEGRAASSSNGPGSPSTGESQPLAPAEKQAIRLLQEDIALEPRPFLSTARRLGLDEAGLLELARDFQRRGVMRRYGAVLHHRRAGFAANAMICWPVPPDQVEAVGQALASFPEVTHCYQRPIYPDWPYSVLTMVHAPTQEQCFAQAKRIARAVLVRDYVLLFSYREFKKERVKYFREEEA